METLEPRNLMTRLVDFDGDRDLDVLVEPSDIIDLRPGPIVLFENVNGRFSNSQQIARISNDSVTILDVDGDNDLDIVRTSNQWHENVDGVFRSARTLFEDGNSFTTLREIDLGLDGDSDFIAISGSQINIFENLDGIGTFQLAKTIDVQDLVDDGRILTLDVGDIGNNGFVDVLIVGIFSGAHQTSWYMNGQDGTFVEHIVNRTELFGGPEGIPESSFLADVDLDGDIDIVQDLRSHSAGSGIVSWWNNVDGNGTFWDLKTVLRYNNDGTQFAVNSSPKRFTDADGDGDVDLLVGSFSKPDFGSEPISQDYWLRNDTGEFTSCDCSIRDQIAYDVGDINNDGTPDFLLWGTDEAAGPIWNDGLAFNGIGQISALQRAIRFDYFASNLDFDQNNSLNELDIAFLLSSILKTVWGDANLDGAFDSKDLVAVFQAGEYEDGIAGNSTWSEGDWDGDGEFSSSDLVHVFQAGGYTS